MGIQVEGVGAAPNRPNPRCWHLLGRRKSADDRQYGCGSPLLVQRLDGRQRGASHLRGFVRHQGHNSRHPAPEQSNRGSHKGRGEGDCSIELLQSLQSHGGSQKGGGGGGLLFI